MSLVLALLAYRGMGVAESAAVDVFEVVTVVEKSASPEAAEPSGASAATESPHVEPAAGTSDQDAVAADFYVADDGAGRSFVMPEGAAFEDGVALVSVDPDTPVAEVNQLLAEAEAVATREVSAEEVASGTIKVELSEGTGVEEAVNELLQSPLVSGAQPEYEYYLQVGTEEDLRRELDASLLPEAEPLPAEQPVEASAEDAAEVAAPEEADAAADVEPEEGAVEEPLAEEVEEPAEGQPAEEAEAPVEEQPAEEVEAPTEEEPPAVADEQVATGASELLAAVSTNDPLVQASTGNDWALKSMHAYEAWNVVKTNRSVTVAVLDAGFEADHEDLKANVVKTYDALTGTEKVTADVTRNANHGTHVAGIVAGVADNGKGVAGISYNAGLMLVKIADGNGTIKTSYVKKAYDQILADRQALNVRVVNLSIGTAATGVTDDVLLQSIRSAYDVGIVTVAAAGNNDRGAVPYAEYPGDDPFVVSVINLTQDSSGTVSRYHASNYNVSDSVGKNVSAPGTGILSTVTGGTYATLSGTSMAAPQVAGIIALEFAANPQISANQAVSYLYSTATDLGPTGFDAEYGWGEANAYTAVKAAKAGAAISGYTDDQQAQEQQAATVTRLYGQNAYDTAQVIVSKGSLFGTGGTVVVATGDGYWDALAASGLAGRFGAPVLITPKNSLASQTKALLESLRPKQVLVMGGPLAVSDAVLGQIASATGVTPERIDGQTAIDTAVKIYRRGSGWSKTAVVATAGGYWDALSVAPYAYAKGMPIFLVDSTLSQSVASALKGGGFTKVIIVGGSLAVPNAVETSIKALGLDVQRVWGQNAIDTSMAIATQALEDGMSANGMGVATAGGYWDALTGAAFCGRQNAVLVLVRDQQSVTITQFARNNRLGVARAYVFGGTLAVSQGCESALTAALK